MDCDHFLDFSSVVGDFGCWFLVFGCFRRLCQVLGLFLLFGLGLKFLQFSCHFKGLAQFVCSFRGVSGDLRSGFCSKYGFYWKYFLKFLASRGGLLQFLRNSSPPMIKKLEGTKQDTQKSKGYVKAKVKYNNDGDGQEGLYDEDEVFDVMTLRKLIKLVRRRADDACLELEKERVAASSAAEETMAMILRLQNETLRKLIKLVRRRADDACLELEKERVAASSAAEETMAMILRLQNEKSLVELESNQFRRLAEEKQLHDQDVIRSLRWIVMKHESERSILEYRLRHCRQKLKQYTNTIDENQCEEGDESMSFLDGLDDGLVSSLDMGLSPQKMAQLCEWASVEETESETMDMI